MKSLRIAAIAVLGYAAALLPATSQARDVQVSLPGISVRLPAPPLPIIVPPGVSVREVGYDDHRHFDRRPDFRRGPPHYYRGGWHHDRRDFRHDRFDHRDHDRRGGRR